MPDGIAQGDVTAAKRFGANLRQARERKGLSQEELAELLDTDGNSVARYERGERRPRDPAFLVRMAQAVDTTVEALGGAAPLRSAHEEAFRDGYRTAAELFLELAERLIRETPNIPTLDVGNAPTERPPRTATPLPLEALERQPKVKPAGPSRPTRRVSGGRPRVRDED